MRCLRLVLASSCALAVFVSGATARAGEDGPKPLPHASPTPFAGAPWLGVSMDAGSDLGVRIESVVRGSPAERGGLRAGDRIVAIDGNRVTAPGHVTRAVATHKVGETISLAIERTGRAIDAALVLGSRPSSEELLRMHLVGAPAPAWSKVTPLSGAPASVGSLKGKVVLIDFWASWCGPCRMIAPRLSSLKDRLGPQGLAVVGITTDGAEQAAVFAERHQMHYPVVVDKDGDTSRAYNVTNLPTMILVDKQGVVRDVFIGFAPGGEVMLEKALRKLLTEPAPGAAAIRAPAPVPPAASSKAR